MFWKRSSGAGAGDEQREDFEALAVDPETPLLQAILAVLAGMEEMEKRRFVRVSCTTESSGYCGPAGDGGGGAGAILSWRRRAEEEGGNEFEI